jgi:hypothetical protein
MSEPFSPKGSRRRMAFSSDLLEAARPDFRARGFLLRYGLEDKLDIEAPAAGSCCREC